MFYCKNCNALFKNSVCEKCGNENLPKATSDDFCFLIECSEFFGKMLIDYLKNEGINSLILPVGDGVRSKFALTLGKYQIFVPYKFYQKSCEILDFLSNNDYSERLKDEILKNVDKWHFESEATEKKLRKKFKLPPSESLLNFIQTKVATATSVEDKGVMLDGEHGLLVKNNDFILWFSQKTFKITL